LLYKFKLGKIAIKIAENINSAFGEGYVNVRTLECWCEKFKIGDIILENEPKRKPDRA
ncbi:Histone-lysine N-methyltransferase SETMAR, partial [Habropoda laboriosa]